MAVQVRSLSRQQPSASLSALTPWARGRLCKTSVWRWAAALREADGETETLPCGVWCKWHEGTGHPEKEEEGLSLLMLELSPLRSNGSAQGQSQP